MTIQITGSLIANNAAMGALIGVLSVNPPHPGLTTLKMESNPHDYFLMSDKGLLYVRWIGTVPAGNYPIRIHAHGAGWNEYANIVIRIVAATPPPPVLSPDGSVITGGTGQLATTAGIWTFGTPVSPPGNWNLLLNGTSAAGGLGGKLEVANGGKMYAFGTDNSWYIWQGSSWARSVDPNIPPGQAVPTALTLTPSSVSLPDNSPAGTRICSWSVTMSDNSQFNGTVTTSDTTIFAISGSNVVTARALTSADDGTHSTTITATQGGQSVAAKI